MSMAMLRLLSVTASTKRAAMSSGKRAAPVAYLTGVVCMPLDPVSAAETAQYQTRRGTDAPTFLYQTVCSNEHDIEPGDVLTVASVDYPIIGVEPWAESSNNEGGFLRLVVEKVKP